MTPGPSPWRLSWRADPVVRALADRHYNRQKIGAPQFVPPGRCLVLKTADGKAGWITSWPMAEYVQHAWAGAWMNSFFRNEGEHLSSDLIRWAVAHTRAHWPEVPDLGFVSFVDATKTRRKRDPGRCYRRAGWRHVGFTESDRLYAFQLLPGEMPPPGSGSRLAAVLVRSGGGRVNLLNANRPAPIRGCGARVMPGGSDEGDGSGAGAILLARLLGLEVARRRRDLTAPDPLVLDVTPDRLAGEAGLPHEVGLPAALTAGGLPRLVERGGNAEGPKLVRLGRCLGKRGEKFGHGLLLCHQIRMPHQCGQPNSTMTATIVGQLALANCEWHS